MQHSNETTVGEHRQPSNHVHPQSTGLRSGTANRLARTAKFLFLVLVLPVCCETAGLSTIGLSRVGAWYQDKNPIDSEAADADELPDDEANVRRSQPGRTGKADGENGNPQAVGPKRSNSAPASAKTSNGKSSGEANDGETAVSADDAAVGGKAIGSGMKLDAWGLLEAGGTIGWVIMALSVAMVALIIEQLLTTRRGAMMPQSLAELLYRSISQGNFRAAAESCQNEPSFLARVVSAGLAETGLGYPAVEKAMEDASQQQAARLYRRLEYFTVIGTIAPMLGLLGTVWGMILAFMEFESKANPSVSELAPGIYRALVTTLQGLGVAIPSLSAYAVLRNRLDEMVAGSTLMAEHVFSNFKRGTMSPRPAEQRKPRPQAVAGGTATEGTAGGGVAGVAEPRTRPAGPRGADE